MKNKNFLDNPNVFISMSENCSYPSAPFSPPEIYPELKKLDYKIKPNPKNKIYEKVRETLAGLGLDKKNYGKTNWNPLKELVKQGDHIVIKPNLVRAQHPLGYNPQCMISHASIIRPIIDYILLATEGKCKITICDVPLQQSKWDILMKVSGLDKLQEYYKSQGISIEILDLRKEISIEDKNGVIIDRAIKDRDPKGYAAVNLGKKSMLMPIMDSYKKFEITDYGKGTVPIHHNPEKNEYCIAKTILDADVFINIPKLKTHRKAGMTAALKNLIGMNGDKRWLAHHRRGALNEGGDEYRSLHNVNQALLLFQWRTFAMIKRNKLLLPLASLLKLVFHRIIPLLTKMIKRTKIKSNSNQDTNEVKKIDADLAALSEGSWYGNDTLWRVILDLNRALLYSDKEGKMQNIPQRKYLSIVDGIIAGEKEGPIEPTPKETGIIIGGFNPVTVDYTCAEVMGFDWEKIPTIKNSFGIKEWKIYKGNQKSINLISKDIKKIHDFKFCPSQGWIGHIEKDD